MISGIAMVTRQLNAIQDVGEPTTQSYSCSTFTHYNGGCDNTNK